MDVRTPQTFSLLHAAATATATATALNVQCRQMPAAAEQARSLNGIPRGIRVSGMPDRKRPIDAGSGATLFETSKGRGLPDSRHRQYRAYGKVAQRGDDFFSYLTLHAQALARRGQKPDLKRHMPCLFLYERFSGLGISEPLPTSPRGLGISGLPSAMLLFEMPPPAVMLSCLKKGGQLRLIKDYFAKMTF